MHADADRVAVLVPAAGQGTRLGGPRKQFRRLGGEPLLVQTLRVFEVHPLIDVLLVAAPTEAIGPLRIELHEAGLTKLAAVVAGGATRQASVKAALHAAPDDVGYVLVHDAVRPFVRPRHITAVVQAARRDGAAALALPVADTLRRAIGTEFGETVPRESLYRMQTPQAFRRDWFTAAHEQAGRQGIQATDDVELVQRIGKHVQIVEGAPENIKITTPADWDLAQVLWSHHSIDVDA
jgi:2-C-methyl-D-erythritol 4-phosphate cytidylyltransferase